MFMKKVAVSIFGIFLCLSEFIYVHAFEVGSHGELSDLAVRSSQLDNFLKTQLNIPAGIEEKLLNANNVIDLIVEGTRREDDEKRFCNHFHNPLSTWSTAGLQIPIPIICPTTNHSSVLWGQGPDIQPSGKKFTWQDARDRYFQALTSQNQTDREQFLSLTFRTLGHLMHLVQDAANPAHTRNDPHPFVKGLEGFVENTRTNDKTLFAQLTGNSEPFDPAILAATPNDSAPIPLAHIVDLTDSNQAAAPSAGINQGIAEYSNSNFLSNDTIFSDFTFPREESLGSLFLGREPLTANLRIYFPKISDGETVDHFVATSSLFEALIPFGQAQLGYVLDRRVFQDYAAKLLPRAIGYSAGLIDYFFRGRLSVSIAEIQPSSDTLVNLDVANATSASDWPGNSETDVGGSNGKVLAVAFSNGVVLAVSGEIVLSTPLTRTLQEFEFDFSPTSIPGNADLMVVYRGPLGLEDDAVIAGFVMAVADDFTRTGFVNLDLGSNWDEFEPIFNEQTFAQFGPPGELEVAASSDTGPTFPGEHGYIVWASNDFSDDQSSTATVIDRTGLGDPLDDNRAYVGGLGVRMSGTIIDFTGYVAVWFHPHLGSTLFFRVYKVVGCSLNNNISCWTQLGTDIFPIPATGQVVKLEAKDNLITVDIDGVNKFSILDAVPFFGGKPGFVSASSGVDSGTEFNRSTWDDWIGGGPIENP